MKKFRDLIARRRPSKPVATEPVESPDAAAARAAMSPKRGQADAHAGKTLDFDRAKAAKDNVPRPKTPKVMSAKAPKIWDIELDGDLAKALDGGKPMDTPAPRPSAPAPTPAAASAPTPARGRERPAVVPDVAPAAANPRAKPAAAVAPPAATSGRQRAADRAKTRLLGFGADPATPDVFEAAEADAPPAAIFFPIGWLVLVDGPGRGASFTLTAGLNTVGRDASQTVTLDFGDTSISRERHAAIAYDEEENLIFVGHGGKSNIVRLNGKPLLTTEELKDGDRLRIGKTELLFLAYCKDGVSWDDPVEDGDEAAHG